MKHLTTILAAVLCAVCMSGCVEESQMGKADTDQRWLNEIDDKIVTAEYRGHSYIIYKGVEKGGITHDPDCPCQKDNPELLNEK
ncbi:hypothetical protein [uncultured Duncaniella sp.]|uniref:hypothetical protein n=1 Tax=uncultured Duncaniella sp. TaxID=2768039 RepID=UPI0027319C11|nr:hypothetical protein [uncultured Duncaniella sp.]